ncbi:MAG: hypothetical protein IPM39_21205 [Chloroflexi bacterium]|nr:hypothetical protein [Chloroflexota bacterium]
MKNQQRLLPGSIVLNVVLLLAVIYLWLRPAPPTATPIAQATSAPLAATATFTPSPSPTHTPLPTETPPPSPTAVVPTETPQPSPTAVPTDIPLPTETPLSTAPAEPTIAPTIASETVTGPGWLRYANQFRLQGGVSLLSENTLWTAGSLAHSRYMVLHNIATHFQDPELEGYSLEGAQAAANGNIAMSGSAGVSLIWPFDYWMSASFHALPMLDPQLQDVGYGDYRDASSAAGLTATLDVKRGINQSLTDFPYPLTFPKDGGQTWVTTFNLPEFPDSAAGCAGYTRPLGAPIIVQIGPGDQTPNVSQTELLRGGVSVPHCVFTETTYTNSSPYWQGIGRRILDERDAIVILPRSPLEVGQRYTVTVVNGQTIQWQFDVVTRPTDY